MWNRYVWLRIGSCNQIDFIEGGVCPAERPSVFQKELRYMELILVTTPAKWLCDPGGGQTLAAHV